MCMYVGGLELTYELNMTLCCQNNRTRLQCSAGICFQPTPQLLEPVSAFLSNDYTGTLVLALH